MYSFSPSTRRQCVFSLLTLVLCGSGAALAQDATGRIIGIITDPSGSVIPKAKITATNEGTQVTRETMTEADGSYQILSVPVGRYTVAAEAPGFQKSVASAQSLEINQSLKMDLKLAIGTSNVSVQVESTSSGVETVNSTVATSVTASQIVNAPLNGRNVFDLALLAPGVIPGIAGPATAGGTSFSVAGNRTDSVSYLLDGGSNNNLLNNGAVLNPNPDAIEEFRILTSNYTAEYGRNAGGVVSVVTRSGTNAFHGSAFEYLRNYNLNANAFFNNAAGLPRDKLKRNQYGGTIGGPVLRNKLFFFVGFQGQRLSQLQSTGKTQVFTPAELNGDFSRSNDTRSGPDPKVVNFLQKYPFFQPSPTLASQGIIDPAKINSVARNYIKAGLLPTDPSGFLVAQSALRNDRDELTEKVDYVLTQSDRLSATLGSSRNPSLTPFGSGSNQSGANVPGYSITNGSTRYFGTVSYLKSVSSTVLNEFRFTAQRIKTLQAVPAVSLPKPADLGIGIISDDPTGPTMLAFSSGMILGFSPQGPANYSDTTYTWSDTLSWIKGRHAFKGGFTYSPYQNNTVYDFLANGQFIFYGTGGGSFSTNDRADFLMGLPDEYSQFARAPSNIRSHNVGWFFQDEWKVRRNLTLTLGIRYEYSSPKLDLQGRSFSPAFGQQSKVFTKAPTGLLFPGDAGAPIGSNFPDRNDWGPRFGFAWDPKGDGRTSIRGGIGVFYEILKGEDNFQYNGQAPFFGFADLFFPALSGNPSQESNYLSQPFVATGQPNPYPSKPQPSNLDFLATGVLPFGGAEVYFVDPHIRTPYVYQYNLSLQRELPRGLGTFSTGYIGSDSHKLTSIVDANPFILGTFTRLFNTQSGLPTPNSFSYVDMFANVGSANYNSFFASLTKRFAATRLGSIGYQISYTYGKSIDNVSGFRTTNFADRRVPAYNWNQFRGVSDFDLTHYISLQATWELPFANAWSRGPKRLTRGWTLYPIVSYRSGTPLDVTAGISRTRTRPGPSAAGDPNLVRPNLVSPIQFTDIRTVRTASNGRTGNFYFDPAAFESASLLALSNSNAAVTNPALRTYGSLGRNAFRGPDRVGVNLSVSKVTDVYHERVKLEIRGDFFNLFNHPYFSNPVLSITSPTFGQISNTGVTNSGSGGEQEPRVIQLSARITF